MSTVTHRKEYDSTSLEKGSVEVREDVSQEKKASDEAFDFGGDSTLPPPPDLTPEQVKKLYRKIDMRLLPILSIMYLCSFLDRGM